MLEFPLQCWLDESGEHIQTLLRLHGRWRRRRLQVLVAKPFRRRAARAVLFDRDRLHYHPALAITDGRLDDPMGGIADPTRREGAFRTPSLRCVSQRPSLMHTGQIRTLKDAVAFHVRGGDANGYFGENELEPLSLDSAAIDQLTAFLLTLDGNGVSP